MEFFKLFKQNGFAPQTLIGLLAGLSLFIGSFLFSSGMLSIFPIGASIALLLLVFVMELFQPIENSFKNISITVLGVLYVAIPTSLAAFLAFSNGEYTYHLIIGLLILTWTNDTFAYVSGSLLGKHKFFEKISPKKTWEGTLGGFIFCLIGAYVISLFFTEYSPTEWIGIAGVTSVAGILGDLSESQLKRSLGVKDSGNILPGHGGMLDRFDAMFFVIPFVYAFLNLISILK